MRSSHRRIPPGQKSKILDNLTYFANKIGYEIKEAGTEYGGDIVLAAIDHGLNFIDTIRNR
ncbi:hypothetical protein [Lentibacillus jeotgali]|uniref:hypothetical protein n=1 Tax=Lentibacillus jeotgali TaxID=558169 RepID=UPI00110FB054|nr:hypothetical protein [Lentibacillus jeotgali]